MVSTSLGTRGFIAPSTAGGGGGGATDAFIMFLLLDEVTGDPTPAIDLSAAGVVKVSLDGAAFANRAGDAPTSMGDGVYKYVFDGTEVGDLATYVRVKIAGYRTDLTNYVWEVGTKTDLDDLQTAIANAISSLIATVNGAATTIPEAVWDALRADHGTAGTFGEGAPVSSIASTALDAVRDRILNYSHRSGRTVRGWIRRTDAVLAGRATGLRGTIARFFLGATQELEVSQTVSAGSRSEPDLAESEDS